jgi:hypothetical protein
MWEEVSEIAEKICNDWELDFLETIEMSARDEDLSPKRLVVLKKLWIRACDSKY